MDIYAPLNNKYYRWYLSIISKAQQRNKPNEYCEEHHVIPRCLGGVNRKINLVFLTAKEHYVCHWLLCYCFEGQTKYKMAKAFNRMNNAINGRPNRYITATGYFTAKKLHSESMLGSKNPMFGKFKEENAMFGKFGIEHPKHCHKNTEHTLELMRDAKRKYWQSVPKEKRVPWNKGKKLANSLQK